MFRQTFYIKFVIILKRRYKLMENVKKLELMIKNNNEYEDIIEQSMQIDKYIDKIIEGAL